jgi:hypothetical protein
MIKFLIEKFFDRASTQTTQLQHFKIEVINWMNVLDDSLPPDIELEIFYSIEQDLSEYDILEVVDCQQKIKTIQVFDSGNKMPFEFSQLPIHIQQEIVTEIWKHHHKLHV